MARGAVGATCSISFQRVMSEPKADKLGFDVHIELGWCWYDGITDDMEPISFIMPSSLVSFGHLEGD